MFERYTDRAKRAVELAGSATRALGHDEIGTDHLLLGLLGDGESVAFRARAACTMDAVTSRHYDSPALGPVDVPLCAPCAAAQGIEVPALGSLP